MSLTESILTNEELGLPEFLVRRTLPDEYVGKRFLDNEEVTILSFLDTNGRISSSKSLMEFMVLMTRIEKMDHRVLCIELIRNLLEPPQQKEFVLFGGYRLLKRWLKSAEEEDHVEELKALVHICYKLPFDSNAAKHSEIGKAIKKLQKYQSKSGSDVTILYSDVQKLMDHWKEMVHQAALLRQQQQQQEEELEKQRKYMATLQSAMQAQLQKPLGASAPSEESGKNESKEDEETVPMEVDDLSISPSPRSNHAHIPPVLIETTNRVRSTPSTFQFKIGGNSQRDRKPLDMLEGARKLLAMKPASSTTENGANEPQEESKQSSDMDIVKPKPIGKGGLKKREQRDRENGNKREKLSVKWADDEGGMLREVQTIEVEKIKSSVATYKTHKDLVKKEKQLEKEVHMMKTESAMHKTTDWKIPKLLNLSLEIVDNIGVPSASLEKDRQDQRLAHVLEGRYLDESLIPNDPDEDPNMYDLPLADALSATSAFNAPLQVIPWHMTGEMEEEEPILSSSSSSSSATSLSSSSMLPFPSDNTAAMYDEYTFNTLLNSLPLAIQMLDPVTLQMIAQNPTVLSTLLSADGQLVDEHNLALLQNCATVEDYFAMILPPAASSSSGGYYGSQGNHWNDNNFSSMHQQPWQSSQGLEDNLQMFMNTTTTSYGVIGGGGNVQIPPSRDLSHSLGGGGGRSGSGSGSASRFPTTKASTPCRFFNTPKGCMNGDKCPFGHFLDTASSSMSGMGGMSGGGSGRSGPGQRGPGAAGPGSRSHRMSEGPAGGGGGGGSGRGGPKRSRK